MRSNSPIRSRAVCNSSRLTATSAAGGPRLNFEVNSTPGCFLHIEDETKFLGLLNQYVADYRPQRQDEIDLLTEAVYTKWKQQRLWLAETAHLEVTIARNERDFRKILPNANAPAHLANAIGKSGDELKLYLRYDAQLPRRRNPDSGTTTGGRKASHSNRTQTLPQRSPPPTIPSIPNRHLQRPRKHPNENHMPILSRYLRNYLPLVLLALLLATINQVFSLLDPLIFRHVIDNYATKYQQYSTQQFFRGVGLLLAATVGVALISRIAKNIQDYVINLITQQVGAQMYSDGIRHSLSLPYQVFEDQRSGETLGKLQKVRTDVDGLRRSYLLA